MSNNGEDKKEPEIKTEEQLKKEAEEAKKPKLVLQLIMHPTGEFEMTTSLTPPMVVWTMEQIKFNLLKDSNKNDSNIIQPKHRILDFAKRRFR